MTAWLAANPLTYTHRVDGNALTLHERATGKTRVLSGDDVTAIHTKTNRVSGTAYHILVLESGAQLAVTDIGFCFAPTFVASGEIPNAPDVVSFGDFRKLHGEATAAAEDPGRRRDALDLMMLLISIVDGGRAVGFDVGPEEAMLERVLARLEGEGGGPPAG
jgi:hypothetical protein